jgi:hypothetical protein
MHDNKGPNRNKYRSLRDGPVLDSGSYPISRNTSEIERYAETMPNQRLADIAVNRPHPPGAFALVKHAQ